MNQLNYNQTGGFGLKTERLMDIQEAYSIFNALGYLGGNKTIIAGCGINGAYTENGFVFIDGEVLEFRQGSTGTAVKVITENKFRFFEDGSSKVVYQQRYVTFASGANTIPWADFTRLNPMQEMQRRILPPGTNPQLYCGAINAIPTGWHLCDGSNGTPNLKSRFIVGYDPDVNDYNNIGKTGGAKEVSLTAAQNGTHSHTASANVAGAHSHTAALVDETGSGTFAGGAPGGISNGTGTTASSGGHSHDITVGESGEGKAHENRPPYYTLAYIIYIG